MFRAVSLMLIFTAMPILAQQEGDGDFQPDVPDPAWRRGGGPVVALDEAHNNFHTLGGRYAPFGKLLQDDGFVVNANRAPFSVDSLAGVRVLVIANALHPSNVEKWTLPTPACFSPEEVAAVLRWVEAGGSLLLIADHMPCPGAVSNLARAFGITYSNGFVFTGSGDARGAGTIKFVPGGGLAGGHPITTGISAVSSFTGSAFRIEGHHQPLLTLPEDATSKEPETAWKFLDDTKEIDVGGWLQGAVLERGRGRVAVFGEAAMFTAQTVQGRRFGMGAAGAEENPRFLRNLLHWLVRKE